MQSIMCQVGFRILVVLVANLFVSYGANSAPRLSFLGSTNAQASLNLEGETKASYVLFSSANLIDWEPCQTNYSPRSQRLLNFSAPNAFSYYRAMRLPMPLFSFAIAARDKIDLNGNNISVDSFDSSDPLYSTTNGMYSVTKRHDLGDVAGSITNSISVGNCEIWGQAYVPPGGYLTLGGLGSIGSAAWLQAGCKGIENGCFWDDLVMDLPDIAPPFSGSYFVPGLGTNYDGTFYKYLLVDGGNYELNGALLLSGSDTMLVKSNVNATLYVTGDIELSGNAQIVMERGASLQLFVGGPVANLNGNGVMNLTGNATNFVYFGLPSNTSISLGVNALFTGAVYAPNATLVLNGPILSDICGSLVVRTLQLNGRFYIHYDEALLHSAYTR
jgi:hypothetical protein